MTKASKRLLRNRAKVSREIVRSEFTIDDKSNPFDGLCDPVCVKLHNKLEKINITPKGLAQTRFNNEHPHYVLLLDGSKVHFTKANEVLVDPTIGQFDTNMSYDDHTAIIPSSDNRWHSWYPRVDLVEDKRIKS